MSLWKHLPRDRIYELDKGRNQEHGNYKYSIPIGNFDIHVLQLGFVLLTSKVALSNCGVSVALQASQLGLDLGNFDILLSNLDMLACPGTRVGTYNEPLRVFGGAFRILNAQNHDNATNSR